MRFFLSASLFLLLTVSVSAQATAERYVDVVFRFKEPPLEGTILSYEYNKRVVLVLQNGTVKELPWEEVRRVNFRYDKRLPSQASADSGTDEVVEEKEEFVLPTPERKFRHQITSALGFGRTVNNGNGFFSSSTAIGGSVAYHLLRDLRFVTLGAGLDIGLMNHQRQENVLAATVLAEVPVGRGRFRPFVRIEAGPSFPFSIGESSEEISSRSVTLLYHPAVGVEVSPRNGGWGKMTLDIGYRLLNSRFELTTNTLDVVERNVNYRRLTLRGGMRF